MNKLIFIIVIIIVLFSAMIVQGEELHIICELKEDLNFKSPVQAIYLVVDMKNQTVNDIPSTVLGDDIITYQTETESVTIVLPSMHITVIRKGRGTADSNISYTGACYRDTLY